MAKWWRLLLLVASPALALQPRPCSGRQLLARSLADLALPLIATPLLALGAPAAALAKGKLEYQPALQGLDYGKPRTYYPDYTQKDSGLQYKVVKQGEGRVPEVGDRVVVDWEGYTIGYYGRPFQTRNKVQGGAFDSTEGTLESTA